MPAGLRAAPLNWSITMTVFDAAQGMTYTQTLVEDDQVFALVGHFGTNTVGATLDYVKGVGIPTVYCVTGISGLYQEGATGKGRLRDVRPANL